MILSESLIMNLKNSVETVHGVKVMGLTNTESIIKNNSFCFPPHGYDRNTKHFLLFFISTNSMRIQKLKKEDKKVKVKPASRWLTLKTLEIAVRCLR